MKQVVLALAAVSLFGAQDGDKTKELVDALSDSAIEAREAATQALIDLGEAAVPELKKAAGTEDPEVRDRAEFALVEIRRRAKLSSLYRETKPFALKVEDVPLDEVLREITQKTGVRFQGDDIPGKERVSLALPQGTLMQGLDALCRETRDLEWSFASPTAIRLSRQPFIGKPSYYSGGFKVAVKRVEVYRCSNFRDASGILWLFLEALAEPGIQITGSPVFQITQVVDETGAELTASGDGAAAAPQVPAGTVVARDSLGPMDSRPFAYSNLNRFARKLARVRGKASFYFALGTADIALEDLAQGSSTSVGDISVQVNDAYNGSLQVTLTKSGDTPAAAQLLTLTSLVVTDSDGVEYRPLPGFDIQNYYRLGNTVSFYVWFNRNVPKAAKSVRLKVVNEFYEKVVPFEFTNIPVP
jgi:hypothetical protein